MLTTNILLLLIFVNIILFLMPLPALHGILSSISGISIYLLPILLWLINSKFGPAPRTPSSMQRSYLLSIDFKVTSITEWAAQLKINPLYAILSGFEPDNTPGVGTFYDFINRLWNSDDDHMSPHIHPLKTRVNFLSRIGPSTSLAVICAACSFRQLYVSFDFFHLCVPPYHWIYLNQMYVTSV